MVNFRFTSHARLRMRQRGTVESEVIDTINLGTECPAYPPKLGREMVFRSGYEFEGTVYAHKQVRVFYAEEGTTTVVVTVITRYGEWKDESDV